MSDADCTPGREPRSVAASWHHLPATRCTPWHFSRPSSAEFSCIRRTCRRRSPSTRLGSPLCDRLWSPWPAVLSFLKCSIHACIHTSSLYHYQPIFGQFMFGILSSCRLLWPPYVIGGHYIFALWFLSSIYLFILFSSPNLSGRRLDVYHTLTQWWP